MRIWFLSDSGQVWDAPTLERVNTPALGGCVGGAEAMTVGLARGLSARGHDVTIWAAHCEAWGTFGGVHWRPIKGLTAFALRPHVIVSVRQGSYCRLFHELAPVVLWAQDLYRDVDQDAAMADLAIYVSQWHRDQWALDVPSEVTPVALDQAWIAAPLERDARRHTFIYASRPERGLESLLLMWPHIRQAIPDARLLIAGYTSGVQVELADRLLAGVSGVEIVRSDDKPGLFRQFARASLLLYPGESWFTETNGSICSQAMAAGVIPLVSRLGALPETVPASVGVLVDGDSRSPAYQQAFIDEVVRLSSRQADEEILARQAFGVRHVLPRCSYANVVTQWEGWLHEARDRRAGHVSRCGADVLPTALHGH